MSTANSSNNRRGLVSLAEAIILQSLEDLWIPEHREESECFFCGEGFSICAEVAGLHHNKTSGILNQIGGIQIGKTIRKHSA